MTGRLDATGTTVFFTSADASILPGGADTNGVEDVFAVDLLSRLDRDSDGLDDRWEVAMGLDYTSASGVDGAAGDPDNDGRTNAQELAAGTHPRGSQRLLLAEGAENAFFSTRFALANPGATDATAAIRLDGDDGSFLTTKRVRPGRRASDGVRRRDRRPRRVVRDLDRGERADRGRSDHELGPHRLWRARRARQRIGVPDLVPRRRRDGSVLPLLSAAESRRHASHRDDPLPAAGAAAADRAGL